MKSGNRSVNLRGTCQLLLVMCGFAICILAILFRGRGYQPDPRFVGCWINADPNARIRAFALRADGTSTWIQGLSQSLNSQERTWSVRGSVLRCVDTRRFRFNLDIESVLRDIELAIDRVHGVGLVERIQIIEVNDAVLKIKRRSASDESGEVIETYLRADTRWQ
jgi:hypothetical protein